MNIPAYIVEALANEIQLSESFGIASWALTEESTKAHYRKKAELLLAAAYPLIRAEVEREMAEEHAAEKAELLAGFRWAHMTEAEKDEALRKAQ